MAENIRDLDISKTFSNVLLSNVESTNGSDTLGIPVNLDTEARRDSSRVQDGLGNPSPLLVSQTAVGVDVDPLYVDSVARFSEVLEAITQSQNNQLIF